MCTPSLCSVMSGFLSAWGNRGNVIKIGKSVSSLSVAVLAISAVGHVAGLLQWRMLYFDYLPYDLFRPQLVVLVIVSFSLSIAMFLVVDLITYRVLLIGKVLFALLLFGMFGADVHVGLTFIYPLYVEIAAYEDFPRNLAVSLAVLAASFAVKFRGAP